MNRLLFLPAISLILIQPVIAQDQAERLFDNAVTFLSAGKYNEAVTDLNKVINDFADSPWASKALLRLGRHYLETEGDHTQAFSYFSRIQNDYGEGQEAPAAYYFKALIMEQHGQKEEDLASAVADLVRMNNLYPGNAWRMQALFLFGKLQFRLSDYDQSLSYFQRLEFDFPNAPDLGEAMLLSAVAAYRKGSSQRAALILARLQNKRPRSAAAERAASWLRLLSRYSNETLSFEADRTFFGATPKQFSSPRSVLVAANGRMGVRDNKSVFLMNLDGADRATRDQKDFAEFAHSGDGGLLLVFENRILDQGGQPAFPSISVDGDALRTMRSAAVDEYGRLYVIDGGTKDMSAFQPDGGWIKNFSLNRPRLVRTLGGEAWVLDGDGSSLKRYNAKLQAIPHGIPSKENILDFRFDVFGNLYMIHDKGARITVFDPEGTPRFDANLKGGAFPLKQAQALAVDASGAVYVADRRGGAVVRFQ